MPPKQNVFDCVANEADVGGFVGSATAGAAAIVAGAPIFPKAWIPWTRGRVGFAGGGPSGTRTSVISATARGFFGSKLTAKKGILGTRKVGGIVGRVGSRASVIIGVGLEVYAGVQVADAFGKCKGNAANGQ